MTAKKRTRKSRKWISRLFFLLLIVAACVLCYFVWDAYFRDKSPKGDDLKQQDSSVETKTDDKKEEDKPEQKDEKEKVPQYDGDDRLIIAVCRPVRRDCAFLDLVVRKSSVTMQILFRLLQRRLVKALIFR